MIWALLALLGIPIWLIGILLVAVFRNRKSVISSPDVFTFKQRNGDKWGRRKDYGRWISDVLIVHRAIALVKSDAAQVVETTVLDPVEVKGLGEAPREVHLTFVDKETLVVAVPDEDIDRFRQSGTVTTES